MGPSAAGKTALGRRLAQELGVRFVDADDYHSPENKLKMAAGEGLSDEDRRPWLERLEELLRESGRSQPRLVLACSALKTDYRRILGVDQREVLGFFLQVHEDELLRRLQHRRGHFAGPSLLSSQLAVAEVPEPNACVDGNGSLDEVFASLKRTLLSQLSRHRNASTEE